jgi:AraC-like DNA-binding protein
MAELVGFSTRRLQQFFETRFGQTPRAWMRKLQCREAQRLRASGESNKAIAYQLGFAHPANFSRAFRKNTPR